MESLDPPENTRSEGIFLNCFYLRYISELFVEARAIDPIEEKTMIAKKE